MTKQLPKQYFQFYNFTEMVLAEFQHVSLTIRDPTQGAFSLHWKYYTGKGRQFRHGSAHILLDSDSIGVLIPELQNLMAEYGKTFINPLALDKIKAA